MRGEGGLGGRERSPEVEKKSCRIERLRSSKAALEAEALERILRRAPIDEKQTDRTTLLTRHDHERCGLEATNGETGSSWSAGGAIRVTD